MLNVVASAFHTNALQETFTLFITIYLLQDGTVHDKLLNCRKSTQLGKTHDHRMILKWNFKVLMAVSSEACLVYWDHWRCVTFMQKARQLKVLICQQFFTGFLEEFVYHDFHKLV